MRRLQSASLILAAFGSWALRPAACQHPAAEIEAESGKLVPPMAVGQDRTASAGRFVHLPHPRTHTGTPTSLEEKKGYVEFAFEIKEPGAYVIEALTYWPHTAKKGIGYGGAQNSFSYVINRSSTRLTLGNDRDFNVWKWRPTEPTLLGQGENVVRFYCREYHARLDKIRVTLATSFDAAIPEPPTELPPWVHYQMTLRAALRKLVHETIQRDRGFNARDDQGLFMSYWFPYYKLTGDDAAKRYMYQWRDTFLKAFENNTDGYYHGFSEAGELHHQTENFQRFLGHFWHLDRRDPKNVLVLEHAAEHVGNWVKGIPAWYDWEKHCFVSWWVGARVVGVQQQWHKRAYGVRDPRRSSLKDAMRPISMVLNAYAATGRDRYLKLARDYVDNLCPKLAKKGWRPGANSQFLESVLLDLHEATGHKQYLDWAGASLQRSLPWSFSATRPHEELPRVWRYRRLSGDRQFDRRVLDYAGKVENSRYPAIVFMVLGDHKPELPHPVFFALGGQIADRDDYFAKAFELASEHVEAARAALATGREPFVDRGDHNRATWLLWYTLNGVYPLLGMRAGFWGQSVGGFDLEFRSDHKIGIPDRVAVLCRKSTPSERVVSFYNDTDEVVSIVALPGCTYGRQVANAQSEAGVALKYGKGADRRSRVEAALPPRQTTSLRIELE